MLPLVVSSFSSLLLSVAGFSCCLFIYQVGPSEFDWMALGSTEFYLVLLGFYWVLPTFTGFYWVLPGFIGFCLVLLVFY